VHIYDIEVADVRAEDGSELVIPVLVKSPGCDHVICLAAKVKMLGELLPQVIYAGNAGCHEIVQGASGLALAQLFQTLKWCNQTETAHQLAHFVRIGLTTIA